LTDRKHDSEKVTWVVVLVAFVMIAGQIAAKATRDAIFLSTYSITDLPRMLIVAAVVSISLVLVVSRGMVRWGPQRLLPAAFLGSSLVYVGLWLLFRQAPRTASILLFLNVSAVGVILISGFWSLVNERFDPRSAKRMVGRVVAAATLGGLAGGVGVERFAAWLRVDLILLVLAGMHLVCAVLLRRVASGMSSPLAVSGEVDDREKPPKRSAFSVLHKGSYLRNLGLLIILGTVAAAIIDYVYKSHATARYTSTESLVRFFAAYYVVVGLVTFLVQTGVSRRALERLGLGKTSSVLPLITAAGSALVIVAPMLATAVVARFSEAVVRNSLFRSAYELFFIPIPAADKRAAKTIIDVGFDRLGDVVGGGLIALTLLVVPVMANSVLLGVALALSGLALWIIVRLQKGYVKALERSLVSRSLEPTSPELDDPVTRSIMMRTVSDLAAPYRSGVIESILQSEVRAGVDSGGAAKSGQESAGSARGAPMDPLVADIADLRSGSVERIRRVVGRRSPPDPALTPHLIPLIARSELEREVILVLRGLAPVATGQLTDALLNSQEEFIIRRRIPKALADCTTQRAVDGLSLALADRRFEVRYKVGIALASIHARAPGLSIGQALVFGAVLSELDVDRRVWQDRRLLDKVDDSFQSVFVDDLLRDRAKRSLEHVFTLLSLAMDTDALKVAFRGLHTDDEMLRGTSIEYLDVVLPSEIRSKIWPLITGDQRQGSVRTREETEAQLLESSTSIDLNLEALWDAMVKKSE
jgi:ATP:ADP antiporter, AAA family